MKHKLMLGFMLSSLLSANSFALEIHGGKLISHKEWTKGNVVNSSVKEVTSSTKLKNPSHHFQQNDMGDWITVHSGTGPLYPETSVPINTDTTLSGYSDATISNNGTVQKTYTITSILGVEPPCPIHTLCPTISKWAQDVVTLDPQGYIDASRNISMTTSFDTAGLATYSIDTNVWDGTTSFDASGNEEYIQVTDTKK